jgi:pilus assembly protein CpaF
LHRQTLLLPHGRWRRRRGSASAAVRQQYLDLKAGVHRKLLNRLNLEALAQADRARAEAEIRTLLLELLAEENVPLSLGERENLFVELIDDVFGLGPIEPLLRDATISDILVNTYKDVFVERAGQIERVSAAFQDDKHLMRVIDRIVSAVGRRVDDSSPMVDARLPDGSRVNAIIPATRGGWSAAVDSSFSGRTAQGRRSRHAQGADQADARLSVALCPFAAQLPD